MLKDVYWKIVERNIGTLTREEQERLLEASVAVVGCGGLGGAVTNMLARLGIGRITVVDGDSFELSNINRQLYATLDTLGRRKAEVAANFLKRVNPDIDVKAHIIRLEDVNTAKKVLASNDFIVDCLDNVWSRIVVSRAARDLGVPLIHAAVEGTFGQVTTFLPRGLTYEEMFSLPTVGKELTEDLKREISRRFDRRLSIIAPTPWLAASIQVSELLKLLTGRGSPVIAPKLLIFDLADNTFKIVEMKSNR